MTSVARGAPLYGGRTCDQAFVFGPPRALRRRSASGSDRPWPVEQGRRHFGIAEDARPFAESEIGGDEDRGAHIEAADEMEEKLASGLGEGEMAEFAEDDEVEVGEMIGDPS